MTDLEAVWAGLNDEPPPAGAGQLARLLPIATGKVYLTQSRPARKPGLLIKVDEKPGTLWKDLRSSQGLEIQVDARPGSSATLQLTEIDTRFHEIFAALVADLLRGLEMLAVQPAGARPLLIDFLAGRIERWQACLKANDDGLSSERQAGLFGELSILAKLVEAGVDPVRVVDRWTGPSNAVQDFQLDSLTIEVKASRQTQPTNVRISSERQLDTTGHQRLLLVHFGLDERSDGSGTTLAGMVEAARACVGRDSHAGLMLDERLKTAGYLDLHAPRYADRSYVLRGVDYFDVVDPMPRIVESSLPVGVGKVSYDLSLAACEPFRLAVADAELLFAGLVT